VHFLQFNGAFIQLKKEIASVELEIRVTKPLTFKGKKQCLKISLNLADSFYPITVFVRSFRRFARY